MDEVEIHSFRVALLAIDFGKYIGLSKREMSILYHASLLHDYGKKYIEENIIYKPTSLTIEEYNIIKKHPEIAYSELKDNKLVEELALRLILEHHERVDGNGYPNGLIDDKIYYLSKILSLCDSYDAMRSNRSYKSKISLVDSIREIQRNLNTQFSEYYGEKFIEYIENKKRKVNIIYDEMQGM